MMKQYQLQWKDVNEKVTYEHVVEISHSCCKDWERLPPCLEMERIAASDINRSGGSEEDKRRAFFFRWIDEKGSEATYERLIHALLEIKCRNDAEEICKLIQPILQLPTSENAPDSPDSPMPRG